MDRTGSPIRARAIIKQRGLSVAGVAQALDYDPSHLCNVLAGHRPVSRKLRRRLSGLLMMDPDELFPESESAEQQDRVSA